MSRSLTRHRQSPSTAGDGDTLDTALINAIHNMVSTKGNPKNSSGYASSGKLDSQIGSLLSAGANPDCCDDRGRPALVVALDGSVTGPDILRQLLAAGASPDLATIYTGADSYKVGDKTGRCGSQAGLTALHCAARRGYQVCVNLLLTAGADVNLADSRGNTALMKASKAGHSPTVNTLLQEGADVAQVNSNLQTALHAAVQRPGNVEVVCLLLDHGAPLSATDIDGQTPLIYASRDHHNDLVEILLEDLQDSTYYEETGTYWLNSVDKKTGKTALHYSVESAHVRGVQLLINHGSDMNVKDATWRTPFFYALEGCDTATSKRSTLAADVDIILKELLEAGCDVVGTDRAFNTTLHSASRRGFTYIVEMIAQTGMSIDVKGGNDGITPLMVAAQCGHVSTVQCLLELGANPDAVDRYNACSLVYVILSKSGSWNDKRTNSPSPIGASIFSSGYTGQNAIMDIMKALLRFNSNPDLRCNLSSWKETDHGGSSLDFIIDSERMYSPLELTFLIGKPDLFLLLVKSGCNLNNFDMDEMLNEYEQCNNNKQACCMDDTTLRYLQEVIRAYRTNVLPLAELCCRPALTYISRTTSLANIKSLDILSLLPSNDVDSSGLVHRTSLSEEQIYYLQNQLRHTLMLSKLDETAVMPQHKQEVASKTKERLKIKRNEQRYRSDGKLVKKSTSMTLNPLESESLCSPFVTSREHIDSPAVTLSDSVFED